MATSTPDPGATTRGIVAPTMPQAFGRGRYRVTGLIGIGGMGLVHRAHDEVLDRDVAIKVLADNLAADAEARTRFQREAQAAARLTHPHVVQVYDVGEDDGRPWFVMELVDGPSLADVLRTHGPLEAAQVAVVAAHALRGLGKAHAAGLLHRDLKPGNLMQAPDGTVKVADFGVAEATELPQLTRSGLVLGTLPYLAPERFSGAPASVRSDLYALGVTLLELLTGRAPEADPTGAPATVPIGDTVPPHLARLLQGCLAADPADRPVSAEAALALLSPPGPASVPVGDRTLLLPAAADVRTEVVAPEAAEPSPDGRGPGPRPLRARGAVHALALTGLAVLVAAALIGLGRGGASDDPTDAPAPDDVTGPTVPAGDTPADTARNLRDWILDRAADAPG